MTTSKANPERLTVTVIEAGSHQLFSQATSAYYGEAGTLAWCLAGRAWLHGYEQPECRLYRGDELIARTRPSRDDCMHVFNRGAQFWDLGRIEEVTP